MREKNAVYYHNAVMVFSRVQWEYIKKCYRFPERKMQILKLLFEGLENDEIAKKLKIQYNTVKAHFGNIYKRVKSSWSSNYSQSCRPITEAKCLSGESWETKHSQMTTGIWGL